MNTIVDLVNIMTSPLSRIMSIYDDSNPAKRKFENNICATHIGGGLIISVAHNLFTQVPVYRSLDESFYQNEILSKLNQSDISTLNSKYTLDTINQKRYLIANKSDIPLLKSIFDKTGKDMNYAALYDDSICKPFLIYNFDSNGFFDLKNNKYFDTTNSLHEPNIGKFTFILELELLEYDFKLDFAIYRLTNKYLPLSPTIPSIGIDYSIYENSEIDLFCLQGAHADNLGRMVNRAIIEGYIDQFSPLGVKNGQMNYFEGLRYLIKGYFRFGSSGAPYIYYNTERDCFLVNALQSEACPQQLLIDNKRAGNAQYINAIATPLKNVENIIKKY